MDETQTKMLTRQVCNALHERFIATLQHQFPQTLTPEKIAEYLAYPDEDLINFKFDLPLTVKQFRLMAESVAVPVEAGKVDSSVSVAEKKTASL